MLLCDSIIVAERVRLILISIYTSLSF